MPSQVNASGSKKEKMPGARLAIPAYVPRALPCRALGNQYETCPLPTENVAIPQPLRNPKI